MSCNISFLELKDKMGNSPTYSAEDLLVDDQFLEWFHSGKIQHDEYWQDRLLNETPLRSAFDQAVAIAQTLHVNKKAIDPTVALAKLETQLHKAAQSTIHHQPFIRRNFLKIAASIVLLISATWLFWPQKQVFQTAFGEMQQITLPDGTQVNLRANSKLWWNGDWKENKKRIVYLEGEAYFDVQAIHLLQNKRPFVVKALPLEVEVLGTEFNIVNRPDRTNIVLVEGKVSLTANQEEQYELKPKEQYAWNPTLQSGAIQVVDTHLFTDWQQHIWHFDHTPLSAIAPLLEQHFGKKVFFEHPNLKDRQLNGTAPSSSLETLLKGIESSLNISIVNQNDRLIIRSADTRKMNND